jgi:hypothetical protein
MRKVACQKNSEQRCCRISRTSKTQSTGRASPPQQRRSLTVLLRIEAENVGVEHVPYKAPPADSLEQYRQNYVNIQRRIRGLMQVEEDMANVELAESQKPRNFQDSVKKFNSRTDPTTHEPFTDDDIQAFQSGEGCAATADARSRASRNVPSPELYGEGVSSSFVCSGHEHHVVQQAAGR